MTPLLLSLPAVLVGCGTGASASAPGSNSTAQAVPSTTSARPPATDQRRSVTDSTTTSTTVAPPPSPLAAVAEYLATREGDVTVGVYDRASGTTWLLHPELREDTASIVKLQIMGAELRQEQITGTTLTPEDQILTTNMIEASDNGAATELWDQDGGAAGVAAFDHNAGLDQTQPSDVTYIPGTTLPGWGLTTTSAADQLRMVELYAYPNPLLDEASRSYALNLMRNVDGGQNWGVTGGVPAGVSVVLKNGWLPLAGQGWQINSVGWVDGNGRAYVLAVLDANNPDEAYGIQTIDQVSTIVFAAMGRSGN